LPGFFIQSENMNKKARLQFLSVSWLLARLWGTLEVSKLTVFRMKQTTMKRIILHDTCLDGGHWFIHRNQVSFLSVDEINRRVQITRTPEIELN